MQFAKANYVHSTSAAGPINQLKYQFIAESKFQLENSKDIDSSIKIDVQSEKIDRKLKEDWQKIPPF